MGENILFAIIGYNHDGQEFKGIFDNWYQACILCNQLQMKDAWNIWDIEDVEINKEFMT